MNTITLEEFAVILNCSYASAYRILRNGHVQAVKVRNKYAIDAESAAAYAALYNTVEVTR